MVAPVVLAEVEDVDELRDSERGERGFGSTYAVSPKELTYVRETSFFGSMPFNVCDHDCMQQ